MVRESETENWRTERPDVIIVCRQCDRFMRHIGESFRNCHEYRCASCGNIVQVFRKRMAAKEQRDIYLHAEREERFQLLEEILTRSKTMDEAVKELRRIREEQGDL